MNWRAWLALPVMAVLAIVQATVMPHVRILGVLPQLLLVAAVAWALLHGQVNGLVWAFVAGLFIDLFSVSPAGLSSLALMAGVAVALVARRTFPESRFIAPVLLAAVTTLTYWFVYELGLRLIMPAIIGRQPFLPIESLLNSGRAPGLAEEVARYYGLTGVNLSYAVLSAVANGLMVLPLYWLFMGLDRVFGPRRVEI